MPVQKFGGLLPKKFWGQNLGAIWDTFPLWERIFPKRIEISKIWKPGAQRFLPRSTKKIREFWSTNHGDLEVQLYPKKSTFRKAFSDNFRLWPQISLEQIKISTSGKLRFYPQSIPCCCPTSNQPGLTLRLLYMYMTMQLRSGHVSLLQTKFQPLNCPPIGLMAPGGLTFGSAPYVYTVFQKNWHPFSFFDRSVKWWPIYMKFLPVVAEEILVQNVSTKCGC